MSPELVGLIGTGAMMVLLFLGVPVAFCMIFASFASFAVIRGIEPAFSVIASSFASTLGDLVLATLPVFMLMGEFADISGIMRDAYKSASTLFGSLKGGLEMATIIGAAVFSAVSGTSAAVSAIMARVALPQLLDRGHDPALATGALAAGGTLGNLIPPGIWLVFYCIMTESSLPKLFTACYIPGLLLTVMYMAQITIQCKINPKLAPGAGSTTWKEKLQALKGLVPIGIIFVLVMGGMTLGIFTPNESASAGAVFAFCYAVVRKTVTRKNLIQAFKNTIVVSGMAFAIIYAAALFSVLGTVSNLPSMLTEWLVSLHLAPTLLIIYIMLLYFVLGSVMSGLTMLLLTMPLLLPVLTAYNIDLIWFGVLAIVQMELANITPPVGGNLFVVAAMAKPRGVSMGTVFRGAIPFCVTAMVFNALLIVFPQIALYLVQFM